MNVVARLASIGVFVLLLACQRSPAERTADQLDNAAEQSDPAAAAVLENAAEQIRSGGSANPEATAQNALEAAGNAQAQ